MKKLILSFSILTSTISAQDTTAQYLRHLQENSQFETLVKASHSILDTTKSEEFKQLAYCYLAKSEVSLKKYDESLKHAFKALSYKGKYLERIYPVIASVHAGRGDYDSALYYLDLTSKVVVKNSKDYFLNEMNTALLCAVNKNYSRANSKIESLYPIITDSLKGPLYSQHGNILFFQSHFEEAIVKYNKALQYHNNTTTVYSLYEGLTQCYMYLNIHDSSMKYYDLAIATQQKISKAIADKQINQLQVALHTKEKEEQVNVQQVKLNSQKHTIYAIVVGITLCLIGLFFVHRLYKAAKKAKNILHHQKKEITDSINYAKGIQMALMPEVIDENVFVLYKPKDIVSGDFYWTANKGNIKYYAVADCTGHGVPGAMLSMLCSQLLTQAIEKHIFPKEIIAYVEEQLDIRMKAMGRNDGMEIALIAVTETNVYFANIKRPVYVVRNSELTTYKEAATLEISKGDMIYMTTDGYPDQFGTNGKKYGTKRLKEELTYKGIYSLEKQYAMLNVELNYWQQDVEQTDDILLMGVRF